MTLKEAVSEEVGKVITALITWGLGVLLMLVYCLLILWLNKNYGFYFMIFGGLAYLSVVFFAIDLWWSYKHNRIES